MVTFTGVTTGIITNMNNLDTNIEYVAYGHGEDCNCKCQEMTIEMRCDLIIKEMLSDLFPSDHNFDEKDNSNGE